MTGISYKLGLAAEARGNWIGPVNYPEKLLSTHVCIMQSCGTVVVAGVDDGHPLT